MANTNSESNKFGTFAKIYPFICCWCGFFAQKFKCQIVILLLVERRQSSCSWPTFGTITLLLAKFNCCMTSDLNWINDVPDKTISSTLWQPCLHVYVKISILIIDSIREYLTVKLFLGKFLSTLKLNLNLTLIYI